MHENVSFSSLTDIICKVNELLPLLMDRNNIFILFNVIVAHSEESTVSSLHMNEFHSKNVFVGPVCS